MSNRIDLLGRRFGRWSVLRYAGNGKWFCRCDCGTERDVDGWSLRRRLSSGCINCRPGTRTSHGGSSTRLYKIWEAMKRRCLNPKDPRYPDYGGRGIQVCDEWLSDFQAFRDWALANGYTSNLTIDRRDNDGNYEPGNCHWITRAEQNRNYGRNRYVTYRGKRWLVCDLAAEVGLNQRVLGSRIFRYGWDVEKAVSTPVAPRKRKEPWKALGISRSTYYRRRAK